jgi:nitrogen fixation NifU-like protein
VYVRLDHEIIDDVAVEADGCAISLASASMLTDMVAGQTTTDALALTNDVQAMLGGSSIPQRDFGEINALSGVRAYPSRVRCAALPWRTLHAALTGTNCAVTTESEEQ